MVRLRWMLCVGACLVAWGGGAEALAGDTWSTPRPGLRRLLRTTSNQRINVLLINLCAAGVSLRTTASSQRRRTPSSFGALVGAHAVINGDFFSFSNYSPNGLAMSGGKAWSGTKDHNYVAPIAIGRGQVKIPHHSNINKIEPWMKEVVSGHPTILDNGKFISNHNDPLCTKRHPRTGVGISQDGKKMIWAVVDGRASTRIGMTCRELSNLLKSFGAYDAVNMDGGGSSAMWIRGVGVANRPSDGRERVVANHLAVIAKGSGVAAHCPCKARCQGTKIYGTDCGVGDCAKFGATCVDDSLGVRCASIFCPAKGKKKVCIDKSKLGDCNNGAIKAADCGQFGAFCSTAGVAEARCVSAFCIKDPKEVHKPHFACLPDGKLAYCDKSGFPKNPKACPKGTKCVVGSNGAACVGPSGPEPSRPEPTSDAGTPEPTRPDDSGLADTPAADVGGGDRGASDAGGQTGPDTSAQDKPSQPGPDQAQTPQDQSQAKEAPGGEVVVVSPDSTQPDGALPPGGCQCQANTSWRGSWLSWLLLFGLICLTMRRSQIS